MFLIKIEKIKRLSNIYKYIEYFTQFDRKTINFYVFSTLNI